ncbi:MAG TPA: hypothetical protein VG758_34490 [Hyphomicrobiaceae bacterium]|jgi:hypothetical protein|nr:hypothetical protein [Hyphomicrobiaceae bacterium]
MHKGFLVGLGAALAASAAGAVDASACSRASRGCGYYAPPAAYQYAPSPGPGYGYGPPPPAAYYYAPPAAAYSYALPAYGYSSVRAPSYYAPTPFFYGDGPVRDCDRGYGYGSGYGYGLRPPVAAEGGYAPAAVWVPIR